LKYSSKTQVLSSKNASVLVPLVIVGNDPSLLFTQRSLRLNAHAGEVCYPGGKFDPRFDTNLIDTAFRETEEELGIDRSCFQLWETLPSLKGRDGKSSVTPVVALLKDSFAVSNLQLNRHEVSEVFTCTISEMCNRDNQGYTQFRAGYTMPLYFGIRPAEKPKIWGLTAIITHQVLSALAPKLYKLKLKHVPNIR